MSEKEKDKNNNNDEINDQDEQDASPAGGLISELDSKLADFLGKGVVDDIESSLDNYIYEQNNPIDSLDSKLDSFLAGKYSFDDEAPQKEAPRQEVQKESQQQVEPTTQKPARTSKEFDAEKLRKVQIEKDLQAIKKLIKPSGAEEIKQETRIEPKSDHQVEKKFKDKEIDDALAALKAKTSGQKVSQQKETSPSPPPAKISDNDRDKSLQDFLKKMDKS